MVFELYVYVFVPRKPCNSEHSFFPSKKKNKSKNKFIVNGYVFSCLAFQEMLRQLTLISKGYSENVPQFLFQKGYHLLIQHDQGSCHSCRVLELRNLPNFSLRMFMIIYGFLATARGGQEDSGATF
jgi:hypothetical protein